MSRTSPAWPIVLVLGFAVLLRAPRVFCRWDEWALHYAGYNLATYTALDGGSIWTALTTWVGLHPPLYPVFHAAMSLLWPAPITWMAASAVFSLCAVAFVLCTTCSETPPRAALVAGLVLATDPVQVHYAAEVLNYPMMVAWIAMAWWAAHHNRVVWLVVAAVLGVWTHVLAGIAIGLIAFTNPRRWTILGAMATATLPLLPEVWARLVDSATRQQPELILLASVQDALDRFGWSFLLLAPILVRGLVRRRDLLVTWSGTLLVWMALVFTHIAAPHQFPYALALSVPAALAVGVGADRPWLVRWVLAVALLRGGYGLFEDAQRVGHLQADQADQRGIDMALAESGPGDAIVLIRGLSEQDDDKRHTSPVLWRIAPWTPMPPKPTAGPPHRAGQPRHWNQRVVYTFDTPHPAVGQIPEERVFTVLYGAAAMNPERIPDHPRQGHWTRIKEDLVRGPEVRTNAGFEQSGASGVESTGE